MTKISQQISLIIPAYNEGPRLGQVLDRLLPYGLPIYVVDDGSWDNTVDIAMQRQVNVLKQSANSGKGAALKLGMQTAFDGGCDMVILLDADGQHDPADLPEFINDLPEAFNGMIVGTRMLNAESMPKVRYWTNRIMSGVVGLLSGTAISDSQSGYRLLTRDAWQALTFTATHFDIESEMIFDVMRAGLPLREVPIRTIYRDQPSSIRPITDTLRFLSLILREKLK